MRYADKIPYAFILDYLIVVDVVINPMFGCYGIYSGRKLCMSSTARRADSTGTESQLAEWDLCCRELGAVELR